MLLKSMLKLLFVFGLLYGLSGCVKQEAVKSDIDMPMDASLPNIKKTIQQKHLKKADALYLSLRGRIPESNDVATAMLLLSQAHIDAGEYLLSKFYADSYITEYPTGRRVDQAAFLRVKSVFLRFKSNQTDPIIQKQMTEDSKIFLSHFSKSKHVGKVKEMQKMFQKMLIKKNNEIALTYQRMGKIKASTYYQNKK